MSAPIVSPPIGAPLLRALALGLLAAPFWAVPAVAQLQGSGQTGYTTQEQRELDAGGPSRSSVLDATNPIDLMNRIRRATAMDDATPPGDAVDAALRDFNSPPAAKPVSPGSALMQGP